ncbi:hypothetical protein AtNW77_Chr3g0188631 [Arabidopsis thaliana]
MAAFTVLYFPVPSFATTTSAIFFRAVERKKKKDKRFVKRVKNIDRIVFFIT